jgi:hypothetical protein
MWVRFVAPFDWKPKPSVTLAYRTGDVVNVVHDCAEAAFAVRAAVKYRKVNKDSEPVEVKDAE